MIARKAELLCALPEGAMASGGWQSIMCVTWLAPVPPRLILSAGRHGARRLAQNQGPGDEGGRLDCGGDEEVGTARPWGCWVPLWPQVVLYAQGKQ